MSQANAAGDVRGGDVRGGDVRGGDVRGGDVCGGDVRGGVRTRRGRAGGDMQDVRGGDVLRGTRAMENARGTWPGRDAEGGDVAVGDVPRGHHGEEGAHGGPPGGPDLPAMIAGVGMDMDAQYCTEVKYNIVKYNIL